MMQHMHEHTRELRTQTHTTRQKHMYFIIGDCCSCAKLVNSSVITDNSICGYAIICTQSHKPHTHTDCVLCDKALKSVRLLSRLHLHSTAPVCILNSVLALQSNASSLTATWDPDTHTPDTRQLKMVLFQCK